MRSRAAVGIAIVLLAFAVRSLHAVDLATGMESREQPGARMMQRYDEGAASIVRGEGVLFATSSDRRDTGLLSRPPGYPLFLAVLYRTLGRGFFLVQLVQNVLNAAGVGLLFLLAGRVLSWRVGVAAGVVAALAPALAYYSNLITPDVVCAAPILAALLVLSPVARGRAVGALRAGGAGLLLGSAVWLRPNLLLLGPTVALFLLALSPPRRWRAALALVAGSVAAVAPITIRNYVLYREVVPVSINFGVVLWEGIGEASGNAWGTRTDDIDVAAQEAEMYGDASYGDWWASPDGIRRDRDRVRRSLAIIAAHPFWFTRTALGRMVAMVSYPDAAPAVAPAGTIAEERLDALWEPGQGRNAARLFGDRLQSLRPVLSGRACLAPGRALGWVRPVVRRVQVVLSAATLALVLVGLAAVLRVSRRRALFLLAVPFYQLLFQSIVHLEFRYTLPMQHLLFVFAGAALVIAAAVMGGLRSRTMVS